MKTRQTRDELKIYNKNIFQVQKMKEKPEVFKFVFDKPEFVNICFW
jgi:hypothetical protein